MMVGGEQSTERGPRSSGRSQRVRTAPPAFQLNFANPQLALVASTLLVTLATIQVFGPISNLVQIALVLGLGAVHWRAVASSLPKVWIFLAYPMLAIASTYWSSAPDVSFRYSVQLAFTVMGGLVVAAALDPRRFMTALYLGSAIVALGSLFSGRYGPSMEGPVMIGLTGSKNQMAFVSQLTLAAAAAIFLDKTQSKILRATTPVAAMIAFTLLVQAKSATGILTALGAAAAFLGLMFLRRFPPRIRLVAVLAGLVLVTPMVVMKDAIIEQAQYVSTTVFKKDATLTGRTYLWAQADRLIEQRPIVGHGYRSVWLGKSVTTTGLLRWANLPDGRGFNFHNTFKEVTVDTGVVGLVIFTFTLGLIGWMMLRRFLEDGTVYWALFFSTYLSYLARAFTELIIGPFAATGLILFAFAAYAATRRTTAAPSG